MSNGEGLHLLIRFVTFEIYSVKSIINNSVMKKVILSVVLTLVVLIIAFIAYIWSGSYNISQLSPHNSITRRIIGITVHHSNFRVICQKSYCLGNSAGKVDIIRIDPGQDISGGM